MNSRTVLALVLLVACDAEGVPAADVAADIQKSWDAIK